ncbi:MAG: hypothetical protein ACYS22_15695 [Planctomycetota bacterium]|jgi:hypothetical protein
MSIDPRALLRYSPPRSLQRLLVAVAVCGGALVVAGLVFAPDRTLRSLLTAEIYVLGLALGAACFLALQHVTSAGWSTGLRRVPEAIASTLPVAAAIMLPVLLGTSVLYHWSHASAVAADPILQGKSPWLNQPFFVVRAIFYFGVWLLFVRAIVRRSVLQDDDPSVEHTHRMKRLSGLFLFAFAVTFSAATFDWIMSLDPHWFSTAYAVYHWSGVFVSGLAVTTLLVIFLRREGVLPQVKDSHLLDLGRLIFGFTTFWAYIWFCQFMLIWYANIPEETTYYLGRIAPAWVTLFVANLLVNWVIPFVVLLPRPAKRSESVLTKVCVLLLFGRWLDLYLDISQPVLTDGPSFGLFEAGPVLGAVALFALAFFRVFGRMNPVPTNDPYLEESTHHHIY